MSNDSQAEDLIAELFRDVAVGRGPGPVELTNLFGEPIRRWIEMTARQDRFVGTYVRYMPGIAGTDVAFIPPDSLRISQYGHHPDARRAR
jgi:hypothetical protein